MTQTPRMLIFWAGGFERSGGIGRVMGNLLAANKAAKRPYETVVIDTRGPYSIHVSPVFFAFALARVIGAAVRGGRLAAHVNLSHRGSTIRKVILCRLLAALHVPYLLHLHTYYDAYFEAQPKWAKAIIHRAFANAERIVVLGSLWHDVVVGQIGIEPTKVLIIRNGSPDPGRRPLINPPDCPLILFLSNLHPWKGLSELLQALGSERLRVKAWRLVCAGGGNQEPFRAAAETAGIADRIEFSGWLPRERVQELLREATILAQPSHLEGLSVTLIEGLAQGVPVIATPVGAHRDILRDRDNSLIVRPGDSVALATALESLLSDPALAASIGEGGRRLFEATLEVGQMEAEFNTVWNELLKSRDYNAGEPSRNHRHHRFFASTKIAKPRNMA
jgi:glycosyltransferase involved in cell wall biosynthesis